MYGKLEISAARVPFRGSIDLYMGEYKQNGLFVANEVTFTEQPEHFAMNPFLRLRYTEAQRLMDELWVCGLRPSEGTGSAGSLAATEKHLEDMRSLSKGLLAKMGVNT